MASTACLLQPAAAAVSAPDQPRQQRRRPHQQLQLSSTLSVVSTTQSQCLGRRRSSAVASLGGEMRTGVGFDLSGLDFGAETDVRLGFQPPVSSLVSPSSSVVEPARAMLAAAAMEVDPTSILLQQRMVFLSTQVDDFSADLLISQLLLLDAQDPEKDIRLLINSPGGSVTAGMGIYDAMKLCRADVSTICIGLAASMGAFLLAAGTKGKRYAMPNSRIMIHQPLGGAQGSAIDVGLQVREMMYHKIKLNKILSRATGKAEEQIEVDTDRDNFMSAWEARDYGLVDAVLNEDNPKLVAPIGEVREPPKTRVWDLWTIKEGRERRRLPGEQNLLKS